MYIEGVLQNKHKYITHKQLKSRLSYMVWSWNLNKWQTLLKRVTYDLITLPENVFFFLTKKIENIRKYSHDLICYTTDIS